MIAFRVRYNKLRSRFASWLEETEDTLDSIFPRDTSINAIIVLLLVVTALTGAGLCLNHGNEIADLARTLAHNPEQQHRNQPPVATKERSTENRTMAAEPLGWLYAGEHRTTAEEKLIKICAYATSLASGNPASTYPVTETRKDCNGAKKALDREDTPACTSAVMDILHSVHDAKLNIVTKGAVAASCNNLDGLQQFINDGTADNPAFPLFNTDYDGMDRFDSVVFSNSAS